MSAMVSQAVRRLALFLRPCCSLEFAGDVASGRVDMDVHASRRRDPSRTFPIAAARSFVLIAAECGQSSGPVVRNFAEEFQASVRIIATRIGRGAHEVESKIFHRLASNRRGARGTDGQKVKDFWEWVDRQNKQAELATGQLIAEGTCYWLSLQGRMMRMRRRCPPTYSRGPRA